MDRSSSMPYRLQKHPQQGEIPVEVTVNNKTNYCRVRLQHKGVGDGDPNL